MNGFVGSLSVVTSTIEIKAQYILHTQDLQLRHQIHFSDVLKTFLLWEKSYPTLELGGILSAYSKLH